MSDTKKTGLDLMREPFPDNQISILCRSTKKDNPKGSCKKCGGYHGLPAIALSYVGHAALTDRLLKADPTWTWEPVAFAPDGLPAVDRNGGMWIRLTVCGVTRLGYGHAEGKSGGDAVKEVIGDALRNAAMRFGAALDLWHKGDLHAHEEDAPAAPELPPIDIEKHLKVVNDHLTTITTTAGMDAYWFDAIAGIDGKDHPRILALFRARNKAISATKGAPA